MRDLLYGDNYGGGKATSRSGLMSKIRALQWLFKQHPPPADLSQYGASSGRRQSARKTARARLYAAASAATRRHTALGPNDHRSERRGRKTKHGAPRYLCHFINQPPGRLRGK